MATLTPAQRQTRFAWAQQYLKENEVPLAALHWHTWQTQGPGHLLLCPTPTQLSSPQWIRHNTELYAHLRPQLPVAAIVALDACDPRLNFVVVLSMINYDNQNDEYFLVCTPNPPPPECAAAVRSRPSEWKVSNWQTD